MLPCFTCTYVENFRAPLARSSLKQSFIPQGMEYRKNVESKRADREMAEAQSNTFNPQICKESAKLYSDTTPVHIRLENKKVKNL